MGSNPTLAALAIKKWLFHRPAVDDDPAASRPWTDGPERSAASCVEPCSPPLLRSPVLVDAVELPHEMSPVPPLAAALRCRPGLLTPPF